MVLTGTEKIYFICGRNPDFHLGHNPDPRLSALIRGKS
jgi:hypothetical protein